VKLGYVNVDEMLRQITWKQFLEWQAFSELEPFDEVRADLRTAHIVSTLANVWRGKNRRAVSLLDVQLPFGDKPSAVKKPQTWQEQKAIGMMMAGAYNAQFEKKNRAKAS